MLLVRSSGSSDRSSDKGELLLSMLCKKAGWAVPDDCDDCASKVVFDSAGVSETIEGDAGGFDSCTFPNPFPLLFLAESKWFVLRQPINAGLGDVNASLSDHCNGTRSKSQGNDLLIIAVERRARDLAVDTASKDLSVKFKFEMRWRTEMTS
jgi:hypothetical protein